MATLTLTDVVAGHRGRAVVGGISLTMRSGDIVCLLGPNGVGKTTLFKTILGLLPCLKGSIALDGEDIGGWSIRRRALSMAYVPQAHTPPFPFQVADVVAAGRAAHFGPFTGPSAEDRRIAEECLDRIGALYLRETAYTEISGGERQLVLIARALAQRPTFLFMDEPTANLDFGNGVRILEHVRELAENGGPGVVMTTHSPNDALAYATMVAVLGPDGGFLTGRPNDVITGPLLEQIYDVGVRMTPVDGRLICLPGTS
jgi:iron complex transport system ATP-binding protein